MHLCTRVEFCELGGCSNTSRLRFGIVILKKARSYLKDFYLNCSKCCSKISTVM